MGNREWGSPSDSLTQGEDGGKAKGKKGGWGMKGRQKAEGRREKAEGWGMGDERKAEGRGQGTQGGGDGGR
jgi:hypothetical protein